MNLYPLFDRIARNWENGNISDAKRDIKNLNKYQLVLLVEYWSSGGSKVSDILNMLKSTLEE
jgi:hypothetical protein